MALAALLLLGVGTTLHLGIALQRREAQRDALRQEVLDQRERIESLSGELQRLRATFPVQR